MSKIEWTDTSWNPVRGCSRVSEGCRHCYAETRSARFSGPGLFAEGFAERTPEGPRWTGKVELIPHKLAEPLSWRKPRRVFVNSMSDLFHEKLSNAEIAAVFGVMAAAPNHTFQVLTKRPERMLKWFEWVARHAAGSSTDPVQAVTHYAQRRCDDTRLRWMCHHRPPAWPLPNVWLGVSVEDQATANKRIPLLLQTPAAVRFVSYEPALGPVDLDHYLEALPEDDDGAPYIGGVDWVIVGGESGPGARRCEVAWVRSAVEQCQAADVPVFVKQLGARPVDRCPYPGCEPDPSDGGPGDCPGHHLSLKSRKGGDPAEWPEDLRVRDLPERP